MTTRMGLFVVLACAGAVLDCASTANAQASRRPIRRYQNATAEPFVSPYLNLIRPGADTGLNYATLVQPQLQQQRNSQLQYQQFQSLNRQVQQQQQTMSTPYGPVGGIRGTGERVATRGNYSHYYPALGLGGSGAGKSRNYPNPIQSSGGGFGMGMGMGMGMGGGFY